MPDGQLISSYLPADEAPPAPVSYFPPVSLILKGLDTNELELGGQRASVSAPFLRFLIGEIARMLPFDADFYASANPDVEAARLAGDVKTLHEHFVNQGYYERRQPHDLPFDAFYYATHYQDLAQAYAPNDTVTLQRHFVQHGWHEGRAAVSWQRDDADRWITAVREAQTGV